MKRYQAIGIFAGMFLLFAMHASFAQAQIVTCELCRFCDIFVIIHNIFNFIALQVTVPLATLMFIIGGLILMFGGSNPSLLQRAKKTMQYTLYGTLIVLLSWALVNTIINVITNSDSVVGDSMAGPSGGGDNFWPWHSPECTNVALGDIENQFFCDTCGPGLSDVLVGTICTTGDGLSGTCRSTGGGGLNNHCACL